MENADVTKSFDFHPSFNVKILRTPKDTLIIEMYHPDGEMHAFETGEEGTDAVQTVQMILEKWEELISR